MTVNAEHLSDRELRAHAHAIEISGHTAIPGQISSAALDELREITTRALTSVQEAIGRGIRTPFQPASRYYQAASALYRWGNAALSLLEHPVVTSLSDALLDRPQLNDLTVFSAVPVPTGEADPGATAWHRDCHNFEQARSSGHLWFLFYLDDFTSENGATWIVPGSHHLASALEPSLGPAWSNPDLDAFPSRRQLVGRAGDLVVIDARALHTSGRNSTSEPRRLLNLGVVDHRFGDRIRANHWDVAGSRIRESASERLRCLLGADWSGPRGSGPPSIVPD